MIAEYSLFYILFMYGLLIGNNFYNYNTTWEYTSAEATRAEAGFETIKAYILRSHNTVAQYIST